jgi:glycosyltransferase involved in cell wall biosynthesis
MAEQAPVSMSSPVKIPRLSIGMPVHNGARFLAAAIDSLLTQTWGDFELIISDNASTDATPEICREYVARDARVRYVRSDENHGAAWNFNRAFELGRGELFKWAAHDDLCAPEFLERCVSALDRHPEVIWCHSRRAEVDESGRVLPHDPTALGGTVEEADAAAERLHAASTRRERFREVLLAPGARFDIYGVGRRDAFARTRLHREFYGADKVFLVEMAALGPWREIPELLFQMRRHPEQSAWIGTTGAQEAWMTGRQPSRLHPPRQLRCALAYLGIALGGPASLYQRLGCVWDWTRLVMQPAKWRRLLAERWPAWRIAPRATSVTPREVGACGTRATN